MIVMVVNFYIENNNESREMRWTCMFGFGNSISLMHQGFYTTCRNRQSLGKCSISPFNPHPLDTCFLWFGSAKSCKNVQLRSVRKKKNVISQPNRLASHHSPLLRNFRIRLHNSDYFKCTFNFKHASTSGIVYAIMHCSILLSSVMSCATVLAFHVVFFISCLQNWGCTKLSFLFKSRWISKQPRSGNRYRYWCSGSLSIEAVQHFQTRESIVAVVIWPLHHQLDTCTV